MGALHDRISLPLKWYLGSYPTYLDAVRRQLRENPPQIATVGSRAAPAGCAAARPQPASEPARSRRAGIGIVFNYDIQAITDAFYFDTFATRGPRPHGDPKPARPATTCPTGARS